MLLAGADVQDLCRKVLSIWPQNDDGGGRPVPKQQKLKFELIRTLYVKS